jgi:hypothetical protein
MNYIVYEVKNKVNDKTYIGKHQTDNIYDDYLGSGKYLKRAINKYGKDCFEKNILFIFDNKKEMDDKEAELVNEEFLKSGKSYNLKLGGHGGFDHLNDCSPEHIERCKKGRILANIKLQEKYGDNYQSIIGNNGGLEKWHKNQKIEVRKKRSEIAGNAFKGRKHSDTTKKIMSDKASKRTGKNNSMFGRVWMYNVNLMKNITVKKEEIQDKICEGYVIGRKILPL